MAHVLDSDEDDGSKWVCTSCISEAYLCGQIARHGESRQCNYCDTDNRHCVRIDWLAEKIDPVYRQLVQMADPVPDASGDDDHVHWVGGGSNARDILYELIEFADDSIGDDLLDVMGDADDPEGIDTDWYDTTSDIYELGEPDDREFHEAWQNFCRSLRHEKRFFVADGVKVLDSIFAPVLRGGRFAHALRTITPDSEDRFLYRGRQANDEATRRAIYATPAHQLGPPPPAIATAGRMNAAGISVYYGSSDATTCVAELRTPVGGSAIVGKFEIIRPLRLLDLTMIGDRKNLVSRFHPQYFKIASHQNFIRGFHAEIRKPIIPGKESLDYLPPQIVAEYLWSKAKKPVDGLIFGSSQVSGDHTNIVLFPNASLVEQGADPARDIVDLYQPSGDPEEEPPYEEWVYYRPAAAAPAAPARPAPADDLWSWGEVPAPEPPAPALRFVPDSLQRIDVRAINYDVQPNDVVFREETAHQF